MKRYRIILVTEYDSEGYTKATYYQVQRRDRLFCWAWRHVKFYDKLDDARFHLARLRFCRGKKVIRTVLDEE